MKPRVGLVVYVSDACGFAIGDQLSEALSLRAALRTGEQGSALLSSKPFSLERSEGQAVSCFARNGRSCAKRDAARGRNGLRLVEPGLSPV